MSIATDNVNFFPVFCERKGNDEIADLVFSSEASKICPEIVIDYLLKRLLSTEDDNKIKCPIHD